MDVSDAERLKAIEDENSKLKKLLADAMLDASALRDLPAKKIVKPAAKREAVACLRDQFQMSERRADGIMSGIAQPLLVKVKRFRDCRVWFALPSSPLKKSRQDPVAVPKAFQLRRCHVQESGPHDGNEFVAFITRVTQTVAGLAPAQVCHLRACRPVVMQNPVKHALGVVQFIEETEDDVLRIERGVVGPCAQPPDKEWQLGTGEGVDV